MRAPRAGALVAIAAISAVATACEAPSTPSGPTGVADSAPHVAPQVAPHVVPHPLPDPLCMVPVDEDPPRCMSPSNVPLSAPKKVAWLPHPQGAVAAPSSPVGIVVADMDADGAADVVVARGGADRAERSALEIHYGPFSVAAGGTTATAPATWTASPPGPPGDVHLLKPTVADVARDGCLDVVVGSLEGRAYASMGAAASGGGARCARRTAADALTVLLDDAGGATSAALGELAAEDLDGDGHVDLAAARFAVDPGYVFSFVRPRIYWGPPPYSAAADRTWTAPEALAESFAVAVVHRAGADGRRVPAGLLFGASAVGTVERPVGSCTSEMPAVVAGDVRLGWALHVPLAGGRQLLAGRVFAQSPAGLTVGSYPSVMDIDELSTGNVFVSASSHKCASCAPRAVPREYAWSAGGDALVPAGTAALPSGAWLVTGVGDANGDAAVDDVVLGRACEPHTQREGQVYVLAAPHRAPTILSLPADDGDQRSVFSRATAIAKLSFVGAGGAVVTRRTVILGDTPVGPLGLGPGGHVGLVQLDLPCTVSALNCLP